MPIRIFIRDSPKRAIALATETYVLILEHFRSTTAASSRTTSSTSVFEGGAPKCVAEFSPWEDQDMQGFRSLGSQPVHGTLGLVTINGDVFLCVVNGSRRVATVRVGEEIQAILSVAFFCLNSADYDHLLNDQVNPFPTDSLDVDGLDYRHDKEAAQEHPCLALKKLLSDGSFYYSADFDLTTRLQDRPSGANPVAIDSLDRGFLWNTYMIQPLVDFRSRLSGSEMAALDQSRLLTSAIRGFAATVIVPSSPGRSGMPSTMTLISRLSCRRAGTRFNSRGIDDDGNVANFVETETLFAQPEFDKQIYFSYVQLRGSLPVFFEQSGGLKQEIQITRSAEATQQAFDKHFIALGEAYGDVYAINLLSNAKESEIQLTRRYMHHIENSAVNPDGPDEHQHLRYINYDFHAETRESGYGAAAGIKRHIQDSAIAFEYYLSEEMQNVIQKDGQKQAVSAQNDSMTQAGIFRTNCLDCLDRTGVMQSIISKMALELFFVQREDRQPTSDFWARHGMLWADCGDALSKIYAGTGALKSSFTRSGKMSVSGFLADARKSAQRLYINNFEDKGRQNTIDVLLGRLIGQMPVQLYDPINDWVTAELIRRSNEYSTSQSIKIFVGTFNLNGKSAGIDEDLSVWLCPEVDEKSRLPEIVAIAFQEIVELDVQQIMSTDPHRRMAWEIAVRKTLNANAQRYGSEEYVQIRGGQLVGASLSVFVKTSSLPYIKNVEGALKKTGMSGMAGNKGAVAVRFDYCQTTICLVTAHLAAGFANYEERNQDYKTISTGLRFQHNRSIEDHNTIIWFGDFNYRIGISNERARSLITQRNLAELYENDQLNIQMVHGKTFPHYSEKMPTFPPTYKYNLGTDDYDTSDKARIPAWCDRVLTRGENLRQLYYDAAPLRFSDHRPVWALFQCTISVIDQLKKDEISSELYSQRRTVVGSQTASKGDESDDESRYGYDSVEPGLPPASSDRRKWWLDNGMPARSTIKPPTSTSVPNPARPANPWTPSSEPDWVTVDRPSVPPSRSVSVASTASVASLAAARARGESIPPKKLPHSSNREEAAPALPTRPVATSEEDSDASRVHLKQTLRKPAPAKPKKPGPLQSESNQSTPSVASPRVLAPPPPDARRSAASFTSPTTGGTSLQKSGPPDSDARSPPPQTRPPAALLDEVGGEELQDWQPLKPQ